MQLPDAAHLPMCFLPSSLYAQGRLHFMLQQPWLLLSFMHLRAKHLLPAALYPIDTIKTRLQLMLKGGGWKALVKQGGAKNLYAGVWGNLVGVAPASAVFMGIYEPVKAAISERVSEDKSFLAPLGAGSAAGVAASVIRVPTEVVKQRLQSGGVLFTFCHVATRRTVEWILCVWQPV